jgi:serine protease Do
MRKLLQLPLLLLALALSPAAHARDDGIESLRQTGKAFAAVARQVSPSVVFIQVEERRQASRENGDEAFPFGDDLFRRFFGDDFPGMSRRFATQYHPPAAAQDHRPGFRLRVRRQRRGELHPHQQPCGG